MATQARTRTKDLYQEDFYVWTEAQAALLRERRFEALDLANLIEEVEALSRSEKSKVLNNASVIIEHLLKLQHSHSAGATQCLARVGSRAPPSPAARPYASAASYPRCPAVRTL